MEERVRRWLIAFVLVWAGVLLLATGASLLYPYVSSYLAVPTWPTDALPSLPDPTPTAVDFLPLIDPLGIDPATPSFPPVSLPVIPSRIVIPTINLDAPVMPVSLQMSEVDGQAVAVWEVPATYAAGWHETSATLGLPGNTVLNGHNTTNGEVFRDLYLLEPGALVSLYAGQTPYMYRVEEVLILPEAGQPLEVRLENARFIMPTDDERVTLVTCHPYGSVSNRLVVIARPAS